MVLWCMLCQLAGESRMRQALVYLFVSLCSVRRFMSDTVNAKEAKGTMKWVEEREIKRGGLNWTERKHYKWYMVHVDKCHTCSPNHIFFCLNFFTHLLCMHTRNEWSIEMTWKPPRKDCPTVCTVVPIKYLKVPSYFTIRAIHSCLCLRAANLTLISSNLIWSDLHIYIHWC